jgi:hypothetical protein
VPNIADATLSLLCFRANYPATGLTPPWKPFALMHCAANLVSSRERTCCRVPKSSTASMDPSLPIECRCRSGLGVHFGCLSHRTRDCLLNEVQVWSRLAQRKFWRILGYQAAITSRPASAVACPEIPSSTSFATVEPSPPRAPKSQLSHHLRPSRRIGPSVEPLPPTCTTSLTTATRRAHTHTHTHTYHGSERVLAVWPAVGEEGDPHPDPGTGT